MTRSHLTTLHRRGPGFFLLFLVVGVTIACAMLGTVSAWADSHDDSSMDTNIDITTGIIGGSYQDVYGRNLKRLLASAMPEGSEVHLHTSTGSVENLDRLVDGLADLGFAQADVYADKLLGNSDRYASIEVIGRISEECVFMARRKDGPVKKFGDLTQNVGNRKPRIAIGPDTSGMSGTWHYLSHLVPGLDGAETFADTSALALNRLGLGGFDAVGWVTDPNNPEHIMLKGVLDADNLDFMSVTDPSLTGMLPNGVKVYEVKKIKVKDGFLFFDKKVKTVCTDGLVLASAGGDQKVIDRVSRILSLELKQLQEAPDDDDDEDD
jgi:TRAP-type uncharacterized transport system substrate-binding protein